MRCLYLPENDRPAAGFSFDSERSEVQLAMKQNAMLTEGGVNIL